MYNSYIQRSYPITARKKKKNKWILFVLGAVLLLTLVFFSSGGAANTETFETITVQTGDTLWGIAKNHLPPRMDIREYIYEIKKANNITGSIIYPGEEIKLP